MDDMGWGDLGVMGHPTKETPNIDRYKLHKTSEHCLSEHFCVSFLNFFDLSNKRILVDDDKVPLYVKLFHHGSHLN